MHNEQVLQQLRQCIEDKLDYKLRTPKDFDNLSEDIFQKTHKHVSNSTLKRLWGYLGSLSVPRQSTLDILAQFIDYTDYESFCQIQGAKETAQVSDNEMVALPLP